VSKDVVNHSAYLERARGRRRLVLVPVAVLIAVGICGLAVVGVLIGRVGTAAVLIGAVAALLPVALVVAAFLWVDRWEPEPARLLLSAFLWGACVATIASLLVNNSAQAIADLIAGHDPDKIASAVFSAPLIEETTKCAFVLGIFVLRNQEFDGVVDGIVYAGLVAAGFAFTENILYFGTAFTGGIGTIPAAPTGFGGLLSVFVLRGVLTPFAHPMFTIMFGIALGSVVAVRARRIRVVIGVAGFAAAVVLHALWNGSAVLGGVNAFFNLYFLVMVPLFFGLVWLVFWQRHREQRILAAQLPELAENGWIARSEVRLLASLTGRRGWRGVARRHGGRESARAVAAYQAAVTELVFLRYRMRREDMGPEAVRWHDHLLDEVRRTRAAAINTATPTPGGRMSQVNRVT
jgi:RsiW-degrading membrane proteinase PrsW (M82 family)